MIIVEQEKIAHAFIRVRVGQLLSVEFFEQTLFLFGDGERSTGDAAGFGDGGHS